MTRSPILVAIITGSLVFATVVSLAASGLLQTVDLAVYDQYIRYGPQLDTPDPRIAILEITERDIREQRHWPTNDGILARALQTLLDHGARAVGLDIYRDIPVPPGYGELAGVLRDQPNIIAMYKFGDDDQEGIQGPPVLHGTERLGFIDLLIDSDTTVRRAALFLDKGDSSVSYALGLRLAFLYLSDSDIYPVPDPREPDWLRLGPTTIRPFSRNDGGYAKQDDAGYQFLIDYRGLEVGFDSFELWPLLRGEVDPELIRDRIVLVGTNAGSLPDYFTVPFNRPGVSEAGIPGVEVHAHIVSQLLNYGLGESQPLRSLTNTQEGALIFLITALGALLGLVVRGFHVFGLTTVCGLAGIWSLGFVVFRMGWWVPVAGPEIAWLSAIGAVMAWSRSQEKAQRMLLMQIFSRHVSPEIAEEIWRHRQDFLHGGRLRSHRLTATVLFVDMKGYTARAEKMDPEQLMDWVNDFMEPMALKVIEWGGVVDDYFGDGIKANFGVPFARETEREIAGDARRAVRCALAMETALQDLNARYLREGLPTVAMRIGIHTGTVVAGSLGSADRLKYTVVGDVVVTAQRLESLVQVGHNFETRPCRILVSEQTQSYLGQDFQAESLGPVSLKGKGEEVSVYRILGVSA